MTFVEPPRAVIFDLDGTLADSALDFDAIRDEIGLRPGLPILEQLADADAATQARAEAILRRHEHDAIAAATLTDGCADLIARLGALAIPTAILTRNIREVVDTFSRTFALRFAAVYTREGRPAAALVVNRPRELPKLRRLVTESQEALT